MRGLSRSDGAKRRGLERGNNARIFARYSLLVPLLAALVAGCATQDDGASPGGGASTSGGKNTSGSAGTGTSGSTSGSSSAGTSSSSGSSSGGTATAGSGGAATSGSAGTATSGSGGASAGTAGASGGAGGAAGASAGAGGQAGAGGTAGTGVTGGGAGGKAGSGGTGGTSGGAGGTSGGGAGGTSGGGAGGMSGGGAGGSGGTAGCTLLTDCPNDDNTMHNVCDAGKCRVRGCNATNCAYDITHFVVGAKTATSAVGQVFVTWDATNMNLDFQIHDLTMENDSILNWEDDSVEIYLDLNHAKSATYDADDFQIVIPRDAGTMSGTGTGINFAAITVARTESAAGYELKVTLPWSALNGAGSQVGKAIGFSAGVNDDIDGGTRETQAMVFGDANNYLSAANFGTLQL